MPDIFDKTKRSAVMSSVHSKGNKSTELKMIAVFHELGIKGWRRGYPVKGKPDFVFPAKHVALFVDGCFWHGHDCRNTRPKDNKVFWATKQEGNMRRDRDVTALFEARRWTVIRVWECELKKKNRDKLTERLWILRQ